MDSLEDGHLRMNLVSTWSGTVVMGSKEQQRGASARAKQLFFLANEGSFLSHETS